MGTTRRPEGVKPFSSDWLASPLSHGEKDQINKLYIGSCLKNLIIPSDPDTVHFTTSAGSWELRKNPLFDEYRTADIEGGKCAGLFPRCRDHTRQDK